jgi:competence protein ComEC
MAAWAPVAVALGGCWLAIWQGRMAWVGALAILIGLASPVWVRAPLVLVADEGPLWGVYAPALEPAAQRLLHLSTIRAERFTAAAWARDLGLAPDEIAALASHAVPGMRCDATGCAIASPAGEIVILRERDGLIDACGRAALVIEIYDWGRGCRDGTPSVIRLDRIDDGTHGVYLAGDRVVVRTAGAGQGMRPWRVRAPWDDAVRPRF